MRINLERQQIRGNMKNMVILVTENNQERDNLKDIFRFINNHQLNERYSLTRILQIIFHKHYDFYERITNKIDEEIVTNDFHRECRDFNTIGCSGFERFLESVFNENSINDIHKEEHIKMIRDIIQQRFEELVDEYSKYTEEFGITGNFEIDMDNDPVESDEMDEVLLNNSPKIVTDNGIFELSLDKVEGQSLQDLNNNISERYKNIYDSMLKSKVNALKEKVNRLEEQKEEAKKTAFVEGLKFIEGDWEHRSGALVKDVHLEPTYLVKDGVRYTIQQSYRELFAVRRLIVPIQGQVTTAYGTKYSEQNYHHPNIDIDDKICLGDLGGKPLKEFLEKIETGLNTCNFDSSFRAIEKYGYELKEMVEEEEGNIWTDMEQQEENEPTFEDTELETINDLA